MKYISLLLVFVALSFVALHAQESKLLIQKNNTTRVGFLKLPKRATVKYRQNDKVVKVRGSIIGYRDHTLLVLTGADTLELRRETLTRVRYRNNKALVLAPVFVATTAIAAAGIGVAISDPRESGFYVPFAFGLVSAWCSYEISRVWLRSLDMESKWSIADQ